jgi:hypothetical protein
MAGAIYIQNDQNDTYIVCLRAPKSIPATDIHQIPTCI